MECKKCGKNIAEDATGICADCASDEAEKKALERNYFWREVNKNQSAIEDFGYCVKTEIRKSENTVIYIATNDNDETVAIKKITVPYDSVSARNSTDIHKEISERVRVEMEDLSNISKEIGNRFVITYYDYKLVYNDESYKYDLYIKMDYLTSLGSLYVNMEYTVADMLRMGIDVCDALEWCHQNGKVHNNLNLNNVFINNEGRYVLGDFAFSANDKNECEYCMAPELFYGDLPCPSTDLYSLGMLMFVLLNGGLPPFAQLPQDIKMAEERLRNGEKPVLPNKVNSRLREVIHRAVDSKADRYASATEFKNELKHLLSFMPEDWLKQPVGEIFEMEQEKKSQPEPKRKIDEEKKPEEKKSEEENDITISTVEDEDVKKGNRKDMVILAAVIVVIAAAIAVGVLVLSNAGNRKIYSLIESESYAVAYKEISELYSNGKNVDSLARTYIDACCDDREYNRVVQAVLLLSEEAFDDIEYFRNILSQMLDSGKYRQADSLAEILYEYENMYTMLEDLGYQI